MVRMAAEEEPVPHEPNQNPKEKESFVEGQTSMYASRQFFVTGENKA